MIKYSSETSLLHGEILISKDDVDKRIHDMAELIVKKYSGENPLFVGLLEGAVHFGAKLMSSIPYVAPASNTEFRYMDVKTYGDSQTADEETMIVQDLGPQVTVHDRPIVIVDDITDSGTTVKNTKKYLTEVRGATDVDFVALLDRQTAGQEKSVSPSEVGFVLENEPRWLVGMGLDDPKLPGGRWLPYVAVALNQPESH
jgi:hypoxanthine phosphoribosyltransferase